MVHHLTRPEVNSKGFNNKQKQKKRKETKQKNIANVFLAFEARDIQWLCQSFVAKNICLLGRKTGESSETEPNQFKLLAVKTKTIKRPEVKPKAFNKEKKQKEAKQKNRELTSKKNTQTEKC